MATHRTRRWLASLVCFLALVASATAVAARQPEPANAQSTFDELWQQAADWVPPRGQVFHWKRELFPTMSEADLAQREAAIAQLPEHPDWQLLRNERRLLAAGADVSEWRVWWDQSGSFRLSQDTPGTPEMPYVDFVVSQRSAFCLNAKQMTVLDPSVPPPPGRDFAQFEGEIQWALWLFAHGGMGAQRYLESTPTSARMEGTQLVGTRSITRGGRVEVRLETGVQPPRVLQLARFTTPEATAASQVYRMGAPVTDAEFLIASTVERLGSDGRLLERWTWLDCRPMESGEFERVTAVPPFDGSDAVRGPVTFTSLWDFRTGVEQTRTPEGIAQTSLAGYVPPGGPAPWMMWATWCAAGLLVGALVVVKMRQRSGRMRQKQ